MTTSWGYTIDELGDILTADDFDEMTASKYSGDDRTDSMLRSATAAVRNYCGWHVAPSASCSISARAHDLRMIYSGSDVIVQLPARFVSAVSSVTIDGTEVTDYSFETNGVLRMYDTTVSSRKSVIAIAYTAGFDDVDAVKEIIAHRVTHALASSYGVQSEAAGGVSVTYSANWINSSRATALADDNKEVLAPYRLQGVF